MNNFIRKTGLIAMLLFMPYQQAFACDCCSGTGPQYKGHSMSDASGYFLQEFDKVAPGRGVDWDGAIPDIWLGSAFEKGWVVKTSPGSAIPGALILGLDQSQNGWAGIVREVCGDKIVFETMDKGKVVCHQAAAATLKQDFNLIGYIWPMRLQDHVQQISTEQAREAWQNKAAIFIDVRTADEYKQGHIPGAASIPLAVLKNRLTEIPKDKKVLLICHGGKNSSQANIILQSCGFANTCSVQGGMLEWRGSVER
ncbi:MAG: rhodanese-like domain-containing protein [Veillonellales bacterium]